jgi:putative acyl-CoA dehydrogenase
MRTRLDTHEVFNQSPPYEDVDLFQADLPLREAVEREASGANVARRLSVFGIACGSAKAAELARLANENPPRLRTFDGKGHRVDRVEYHPAYHELMARSFAEGLHCSTSEHPGGSGARPQTGANVVRAAGFYMAVQMEPGHCCPVTMTHAAVPTLELQPDVSRPWLAAIRSRSYDPAPLPLAKKSSVTIGMGMTEKQGGTDVRANTTRAVPCGAAGPGREYLLTGHKWFLSAPMSDAFLVLAQTERGLSCFLLPRLNPDGTLNGLYLQRLKDKLGNRSNASSEVEFRDARAWLIGEEGRGVPNIIEMVTRTRLDCAISSAALMRQALATAVHHARHRSVFGKRLADQPLMGEVLADMALDVEAATALVFRLARAFDLADDPRAGAFARLMTPVTKYWVCKIAPALVCEAMECLGGNGYVEEGTAARTYREAPVNAIWEGSGNVMALDVLRVLQREPEAAESVLEDLAAAIGDDRELKAGLARIEAMLHEPRLLDRRGRTLADTLAALVAGSLLRAHAPSAVADAFIATRVVGRPGQTYGVGIDWADSRAILDRVLPS